MKELIPKPASQYLLVRCEKCNNTTIVYSHVTKTIHCKSCNTLLAENTGGKAIIHSQILKRLDNP